MSHIDEEKREEETNEIERVLLMKDKEEKFSMYKFLDVFYRLRIIHR